MSEVVEICESDVALLDGIAECFAEKVEQVTDERLRRAFEAEGDRWAGAAGLVRKHREAHARDLTENKAVVA